EGQRREACGFDGERLRPYFPYARVLETAQELTTQLFSVRWERIDTATWHPSVSAWNVLSDEKLLATVYVDPFTREGKREGAWMSPILPCVPGLGPGVVVLATDIAPPSNPGDAPCLSIEEVARFLHEMGHVMHHVLSRAR